MRSIARWWPSTCSKIQWMFLPIFMYSTLAHGMFGEGVTKTKEIVFVDTSVEEYQILLENITADKEVVLLDKKRDGLLQISETLNGRSEIEALHIISHGEPGAMQLGASSFEQHSLQDYRLELKNIGASLSQDGDIFLYGCKVAQGVDGKKLINQLSEITQADVAASDDLTGSSRLGGDWNLEVQTGRVNKSLTLKNTEYPHVLDIMTFDSGASHPGFTFTDFVYFAGTIGLKNMNVDATSQITINSGTFDVQELKFGIPYSDAAAYLLTGSGGQSYTIPANYSGPINLNWIGVSWIRWKVTGKADLLTGTSDIDDIVFTIPANNSPTVSGVPSDLTTVTEDTLSNIDLSAATFADADGDNLTVTLNASAGTFSAPADGAGIGSGVTETQVSSTRITLAGNAGDINTYLDNASNIQYTGALNSSGNNAATITISAIDGNGGTLSANPVVNLDIVPVPDSSISGIDISNDTGTSATDFLTNMASQTISGTLSAGLSAGEILNGSVDGGSSWTDVTANVSGTSISWVGATLLGSNTIQFKVTEGSNDGPVASQSYTLDTTAPTTTMSDLDISDDMGISQSDFETNIASQTITATLSTDLVPGEILLGSTNGGSSWTDISSEVAGTAISWDGATLSGTSSIQLKVRDAAGNDGTTKAQAYVLDTTAPTTTISGIDISDDTGNSSSDFETNIATQTITATLSTGLAMFEQLYGSVDGGSSWSNLSKNTSGTAISWTGATFSGTSSIQFKVTDDAGNDAPVASQPYTLDTTAPTTTVSGIDISVDTGASDIDFITNTASQTVSASLSTNLAPGEILQGSIDGGSSWSNISSEVSGTSISWDGATLSGTSSIQLKVTDRAGNDAAAASQAYILDTVSPTTIISSIDISADTGSSDTDFLTNTASQTITATLSSELTTGEVLYGSVDAGSNWSNISAKASGTAISWDGATLSGTSSIQLKITDAAGNDGSTGIQPYTLDATPPTVTGSATIGSPSGNDTSVTFRVSFDGTVENIDVRDFGYTFTGTAAATIASVSAVSGSSVDVTLNSISGDGTLRLDVAGSHNLADVAGNLISGGYTGGTPHIVDFSAPTTAISGIGISSDSGTSNSDFITNIASQTITATLSTNLVAGEILNGSVDGGSSWTDITSYVAGTAISWDSATLSGTSSIQLKVTDGSNNDGPVTSQVYVLDTVAPTNSISGSIALSSDTGVSNSDFITNTASQTISATLFSTLNIGEILIGSVDGGSTWTDITSKVTGTNINWDGATLLSGSNFIRILVTDIAGNNGTVTLVNYVLDVTPPTTTISNIDISADNGQNFDDFITDTASQTITGTLSTNIARDQILYGSVDAGANWTNVTSRVAGSTISWTGATLAGSSSIQFKVADTAGNDGPEASQAYTLDTTAPAITSCAPTGSPTGSDSTVIFRVNLDERVYNINSADFNLSTTGTASGDITAASATDGTMVDITVNNITGDGTLRLDLGSRYLLNDLAGNNIIGGYSSGTPHIVDFTAPTTTVSGINISADSGTSDSDFITNIALQTITASLSAGLAPGEILNGSVDSGGSWTDITNKVSGITISWDGASLAGSSVIQLKVSDEAANDGPVASQIYTLDTTAPTTLMSGVDISSDTGSSDSDFITRSVAQIITGNLSISLPPGETLFGSVDAGATWTDITSKVVGNALSWDGTALSGSSAIQFKLTDVAANESLVADQAYVLDLSSPVFTDMPGDITVNADPGKKTATVEWSAPTANDDHDGVIPPVQTSGLTSGSAFPQGETVIAYEAIDAAGNSSNASFTITVGQQARFPWKLLYPALGSPNKIMGTQGVQGK